MLDRQGTENTVRIQLERLDNMAEAISNLRRMYIELRQVVQNDLPCSCQTKVHWAANFACARNKQDVNTLAGIATSRLAAERLTMDVRYGAEDLMSYSAALENDTP